MASDAVAAAPRGSAQAALLAATPVAVGLATVLPGLIAFNQPPSPTLLNQLAALGLWGLVLVVLALAPTSPSNLATAFGRTRPLVLALALVLGAALLSCLVGALPASLALSAAGTLLAAIVLVLAGASLRRPEALLAAFCAAWVLAGVCSAAIAVVQVFAPDWPDGDWVARSGLVGRAVGNLRQPNHLASLLLWSAAAVVPLIEMRRLKPRWLAAGLFMWMVLGITLSGSRTGMVGVAVLALWGLLDSRLTRPARGLLLAGPLVYGLSWLGLSAWAEQTAHTFGAAARLAESDVSGSRFAIWRDTLALLGRQPWTGVGYGEFNFAWSLTPFPHRPVAFFDHTHNLPLQLAVELGLPLSLLVVALLGVALWQAWRRSRAVAGEAGVALRATFAMVLLMALHSQLEYPLWYAHFLLPTALAWGLCLGADRIEPASSGTPPRWLLAGGAALALAAVVVLVDYHRVVVIFSPPAAARPLDERIADGQRSWFFAHHADYAAATTAERPADAMSAFTRAPHHLLDTRLMIAWAKALAQTGDLERARHMAARLREFRNPNADDFFAPCADAALKPRPFQCEAPSQVMDWRDFR